MRCLTRRIVDGAMLHLLKMWLVMPVEEIDERGNRQRTTRNKDEGKGTPQGAPISPLLSNLYMRRFVLGWKTLGHESRLQAYIVNYADDFVICCRRGMAPAAMQAMRNMMAAIKLTVNEEKTRVRQAPAEAFDFLGYTFGLHWTRRRQRMTLCEAPSKKRVMRVCRKVSMITDRRRSGLDVTEIVKELNDVLRGWANYFCLGPVSNAYRAINSHTRYRFRRWWKAKHKGWKFGPRWYWSPWLEQAFGLLQLRWDPSRLPHAKA
jgi:hypothetical protein